MNVSNKFLLQFELLWIAITVVVAAAVLYPVLAYTENYPFLGINILFIVAFITITRHILFLKFTFLGKIQWLKMIIIAIIIPTVFSLGSEVHAFQSHIDNYGVASFFYEKDALNVSLANYVQNQFLLFGIGSVMAGVMLPFRLLISIWRWKNKGTI